MIQHVSVFLLCCVFSFSSVDDFDLFHLFFSMKAYPRNNHIVIVCTQVNVYVHTGVVLCLYEYASRSYVCVHVRDQVDIDNYP